MMKPEEEGEEEKKYLLEVVKPDSSPSYIRAKGEPQKKIFLGEIKHVFVS
jgi:hypothetical protein